MAPHRGVRGGRLRILAVGGVVGGRLREAPGSDEGVYFPGRVPQHWPEGKDQWQAFRFPDFLPRRLPDITAGRPLPHLNMDHILFALVEDLLR